MPSALDLSGAREKLSDLFISKERANGLVTFNKILARGKPAIAIESVPGSLSENYTVATDTSLVLTCELVRFFVILHHLGLTFKGQLMLDEVYFTITGRIRLLENASNKLELMAPLDDKLDAKFLVQSIKLHIFAGGDLPTDMQSLLSLLENNYGPSLRMAVYNHPGLLMQHEKLSQFGLLYIRVLQIEKSDKKMYERIINSMPFCSLDENHWKFKALGNDYLQKILLYRQEQTHPMSSYQRSINATSASKGSLPNPQGQAKPQGRKYHPPNNILLEDALRAERAMNSDPGLVNNSWVHTDLCNEIQNIIKQRKQSGVPLPVIPLDNMEDRRVMFRIILDDMGNYDNAGGGMLRDMRNSDQHIHETFLKELQLQIANAVSTQQPAINQAATATSVQSTTVQQPAAAQQQAPSAPVPEYHKVENIFGANYPGALCEFFLAMVRENQVTYLYDVESFLKNFSP